MPTLACSSDCVRHPSGAGSSASDPEVQAFLQTALDTDPVVQVLRDGGPATGVSYSEDGRFVATGHADATVRIRDSSTGAVLRTLNAAASCAPWTSGPAPVRIRCRSRRPGSTAWSRSGCPAAGLRSRCRDTAELSRRWLSATTDG